jgi:hypothetical protein
MVPSSFFMNSGVNVDPTLKLVFVIIRHDPDQGIKKVIMPTFMLLKPRKWFNILSPFINLGMRFLEWGRVVTPLVLLY